MMECLSTTEIHSGESREMRKDMFEGVHPGVKNALWENETIGLFEAKRGDFRVLACATNWKKRERAASSQNLLGCRRATCWHHS